MTSRSALASKAAMAARCEMSGARDVEVLGDALDRAHQRLGQHHPADAPAGHAVVFGERVDDDRVAVGELQRGRRRAGVDQAVVDLVGDEEDAEILGRLDQRLQRVRRHHRAGRIGGAGDEHAGERLLRVRLFQHRRRQRVAGVGVDRNLDGLKAEGARRDCDRPGSPASRGRCGRRHRRRRGTRG